MGNYLNPDNENFQKIRNSSIYVDKTGIIELLNKRVDTWTREYVCVSRPRRFGKSTAAETVVSYYSRGCQSKELFGDLEISRCADFEKHLNRYNVIHLVMTRFSDSSKTMREVLNGIDEDVIREIKEEYPSISFYKDDLISDLEQIYKETHVKFVLVIDEWDCFFREKSYGLDGYNEYVRYLSKLLKEQKYLALCYMTGILPVKKHGEHSALDMFDEISITDAGEFAKYTGFTEDEVKELCDKYERPYEDLKEWYNGYNVEGMTIYNPKSVADSLYFNKLQSYWTKTERFEEISVYIEMNVDGVNDAIIDMLGGKEAPVDITKFKNDLENLKSMDDVLTLLIHLGYLTYNPETKTARIPNKELREQFIGNVMDLGWGDVAEALKNSNDLLKATLALDEKKVAEYLSKAHNANTSIAKYNNEDSLSCVVTIAYYSAAAYYGKVREMPAGKGFADLVFIPKVPGYPAMVVELKYDKTAKAAISQIKEKSYVDSLGFYKGDILLVGINYDKETKEHTCVIERVQK